MVMSYRTEKCIITCSLSPVDSRWRGFLLPVYRCANTGDVTKCQPCLYVLKSGNFERYISVLIQATLGYNSPK